MFRLYKLTCQLELICLLVLAVNLSCILFLLFQRLVVEAVDGPIRSSLIPVVVCHKLFRVVGNRSSVTGTCIVVCLKMKFQF